MATIQWVVFKHHKKADGTYNPKIRVTHRGRSSYVATSIYTKTVRFRKGAASGTVTDERVKEELDDIVKRWRSEINEMAAEVDDCESSAEVVALVNRRRESLSVGFVAFSKKMASKAANKGTREAKMSAINDFHRFLREDGMDDIEINKLSSAVLRRFEGYLRKPRFLRKSFRGTERDIIMPPCNNTGINVIMSHLRCFFNQALAEYNDYDRDVILIKGNPFRSYKMPAKAVPPKRAVDAATIRKIYEYQTDSKPEMLVRDMFILSFALAGTNPIDLATMVERDGRVEYERSKTRDRRADKAFISLPITPVAREIIDRYKSQTGQYCLNILETYKRYIRINNNASVYLPKMCEAIGIPPVQFYAARHSFATIARNDCGVSKDDIALCLNHSQNRSVTDAYIKPDWSRVDEVVEKVVRFVFGDY